jgi:hypothetical protein
MYSIKNQEDIINQIKLFTSLNNTSLNTSNTNSLNISTKDPISFLFNISKIFLGTNNLENLLKNLLNEVLTDNFINELNENIFEEFKLLINNTTNLNELNNSGINIPIKSINIFNQLKTNNEKSFFENILYTNVLLKPNQPYTNNNIILTYINTENILNVKSSITNNITLLDSLKNLVQKLINKNQIIDNIINLIFNKTTNEDTLKAINIINDYKNLNTKNFTLNVDEFLKQQEINNINGFIYNVNCFTENINIDENMINELKNNFNIQTLENNFNLNNNFKEDLYKNIINNIFNSFLLSLVKSTEFMFLINLSNKLNNKDFNFSDSLENFFTNFSKIIEKIFDMIYQKIYCFLFDYIKKELIKLVTRVTIKLLKEKLTKRLLLFKSLIKNAR